MAVSVSYTLQSHDGSSSAWRPVTLASSPPTRSCHIGQWHAHSHVKRGRVARRESVFSAGRFSEVDKEHVTKQPANTEECDAIQLLMGWTVPNQMGCVTCDWCADACELGGVRSFLSECPVLPPRLTKIHYFPGFHCVCWNAAALVDQLRSSLLHKSDLIWLLRSA